MTKIKAFRFKYETLMKTVCFTWKWSQGISYKCEMVFKCIFQSSPAGAKVIVKEGEILIKLALEVL